MNQIPSPHDLTGIDRSIAGLAGRRWTTAELRARIEAGLLDSDEEFELIHGEIVPVCPEGEFHMVLRLDMNDHLVRRRTPDYRVEPEAQIDFTPDTYRKPDFVLRPASIPMIEVRGPDALLIIEISDTSLATDLRAKAPLYASFGVRDYWVISARSRVTWIHREPSPSGFGRVDEFRPNQLLVPLLIPALTVRLDDVGV